eukprot:8082316-Pyramimonas_sp.AAC.1
METLNKAEQRQRTWFITEEARLRRATVGRTFSSGQSRTVPARKPAGAAAQPPALHSPCFQYLEPLIKLRFVDWLKHGAGKTGDDPPTAANWWPLIWAPDVDKYARLFRCSALEVFDWTHVDADQIGREEG